MTVLNECVRRLRALKVEEHTILMFMNKGNVPCYDVY